MSPKKRSDPSPAKMPLWRFAAWVVILSWPFLAASSLRPHGPWATLLLNGLGMVGAGVGALIAAKGQIAGRRWGSASGYLWALGFSAIAWGPPALLRLAQGAKPVSFTPQLAVELVGLAVIYPVFALGEEVAWRGVLLPRLAPRGDRTAAALVGLAWGFWHAPLLGIIAFKIPLSGPLAALPPLVAHLTAAVVSVVGVAILEISLSALFAVYWGRFRSMAVVAVLHGSYDGVRDGAVALFNNVPPSPHSSAATLTAALAGLVLLVGLVALIRGRFGLAEVTT